MKTLTTAQKGVVRGGVIAVAIAIVVGIPALLWLPASWVGAEGISAAADRISYAFKWNIPILLWLAACIRHVSRGRFRSKADIDGSAFSEPSPAIAVRRAVLQNSLEQSVLTIGANLALAVTVTGRGLVAIPVVTGLFLAGRVWFSLGYKNGAPGRAPGMVLTMAPTVVALGAAGILALMGR